MELKQRHNRFAWSKTARVSYSEYTFLMSKVLFRVGYPRVLGEFYSRVRVRFTSLVSTAVRKTMAKLLNLKTTNIILEKY
jgi:hypothetical protein